MVYLQSLPDLSIAHKRHRRITQMGDSSIGQVANLGMCLSIPAHKVPGYRRAQPCCGLRFAPQDKARYNQIPNLGG
jgi:hypothetical protein